MRPCRGIASLILKLRRSEAAEAYQYLLPVGNKVPTGATVYYNRPYHECRWGKAPRPVTGPARSKPLPRAFETLRTFLGLARKDTPSISEDTRLLSARALRLTGACSPSIQKRYEHDGRLSPVPSPGPVSSQYLGVESDRSTRDLAFLGCRLCLLLAGSGPIRFAFGLVKTDLRQGQTDRQSKNRRRCHRHAEAVAVDELIGAIHLAGQAGLDWLAAE